ncbi:MAG: DUF2993 domain-containing protein [Capsulimonadaceae bacterium]
MNDPVRRRSGLPWPRVFALAAASVLAATLSGCVGPDGMAAHKIADILPQTLGPAKSYNVQVDAPPLVMLRGHAHKVVVDGQDVQLPSGLTVDQLHVEAHDLALNTRTHQLDHAGQTTFTLAIGQLHLDDYIAHQKGGVRGLRVQIRWNDIEASLPVGWRHMETTVRVDGVLRRGGGGPATLDFVPSGGQVGIIHVPGHLVEMALRRVNPVIDIHDSRIPVSLISANAVNGRLMVNGSLTLGNTNM